MDFGKIIIAKALYDDLKGMDKILGDDIANNKRIQEEILDQRARQEGLKRILDAKDVEHNKKLEAIKDENLHLYAELEIMRKVVNQKNEVIKKARDNLVSYQKLSIVLTEDAKREKAEKEILKETLLNANFLELAEFNGKVKEEVAEERAFLHKWILSRNSFWEMAYRLAKENGIDITMEELKRRADEIKDELLEAGFSSPEFKEESDKVKGLKDLSTKEYQNDLIDEEVEEQKEIKKMNGELSLDEKLKIADIDYQMELLKEGIDPDLPMSEQIKP